MTLPQVAGPRRIIVMGVSGCGKSTVGAALAKALARVFVDGDDLHPQSNRDKMAAGTPLTDEDRLPWLDRVGETLASGDGAVIACSALKRSYRDRIRNWAPDTVFIHLTGSEELLAARHKARTNHFMPTSLLRSQLDTLEDLEPTEMGAEVSIDGTEAEVTAAALTALVTLTAKPQ
jgi:carbohydrate kinase (thermoresistant glucokinase family)